MFRQFHQRGVGWACWLSSSSRALTKSVASPIKNAWLLCLHLVVFAREFGRTPRSNRFQARDQWAHSYSHAFAGARVPGGQSVGRTDRDGGYVLDRPYLSADVAASDYEKLDFNRSKPVYTPTCRLEFLAHSGRRIEKLSLPVNGAVTNLLPGRPTHRGRKRHP